MTSEPAYQERSKTYLKQASEELQKGDLCQASEKGWGAAAEMVKAAALKRDWGHNTHRQLQIAVNRLSEETGNTEIRVLFAFASQLHINFYEGWLDYATVNDYLGRTAQFVEMLDGA